VQVCASVCARIQHWWVCTSCISAGGQHCEVSQAM